MTSVTRRITTLFGPISQTGFYSYSQQFYIVHNIHILSLIGSKWHVEYGIISLHVIQLKFNACISMSTWTVHQILKIVVKTLLCLQTLTNLVSRSFIEIAFNNLNYKLPARSGRVTFYHTSPLLMRVIWIMIILNFSNWDV